MADEIDLLKVKIEEAKSKLPDQTRRAIEAVDWRAVILGMRKSKGYTFEQLGDLETETELLLAGLVEPARYPLELERHMRVTKAQADELVNEMNMMVFSKIREEMIKDSEKKREQSKNLAEAPVAQSINREEIDVLQKAGIRLAGEPDLSKPELAAPVPPPSTIHKSTVVPSILTQKLSDTFKMQGTKTEHAPEATVPKTYPKGDDPYRLPPE